MTSKAAKASTDDLYRELPRDFAGCQRPVHKLKDKAECNKRLVESFLKRSIPNKRFRQADESDLAYKVISLDARRQKPNRSDTKRRKRKTLTTKERKGLNLFKLNPEDIKYELYIPLHELWKDYMRDLLGVDKISARNLKEAEKRLLKADYHGSLVTVAKSTCPSLVGKSGIILQETKNTFKIVSTDDSLKTIPKKNAVFSICLDDYNFQIFGNNFMFRASDRACRSFKPKPSIAL